MNMEQIMRNAQNLQKQMMQEQDKFLNKSYQKSSVGELINMEILGNGVVKSIKINQPLKDKDDIEMVEDLIVATYNQLKNEANNESQNYIGQMTKNLGVNPNFKF